MASLCHRRLSRQSISESIFSHLAVISCQQQEGETHPHTSHPPLSTTFSYNSTNFNQFSNDYSPSTPLTRTELITVTPITRLFMMSSMCCTVMMNLTPDDHCVTVCPGIYWQQCERPAGRELSGVECTVFSPGVQCTRVHTSLTSGAPWVHSTRGCSGSEIWACQSSTSHLSSSLLRLYFWRKAFIKNWETMTSWSSSIFTWTCF